MTTERHTTLFSSVTSRGVSPRTRARRTLSRQTFAPPLALVITVAFAPHVAAQTTSAPSAAGRGAVASTAPRTLARAITPQTLGAHPRLPLGPRLTGLSTIQGSALSAANTAVPHAVVRLRDARIGRIVGSAVTDETGAFAFSSVNPGSYIAEVLDADQSVLTASQLIGANADQAASVVLKLPSRLSTLAKMLGPLTPSANALTTQAAGLGTVATGVFGPSISER
jgi:hypothetical protein